MSTRFELNEVVERDGIVWVGITAFRAIPGSEVRVGANYQRTEAISTKHWQYKDGQLLAINDKAEWAVFTERNDETSFVLAALRSCGYVRE